MNLNKYFNTELNKRVERAEKLLELIKPLTEELITLRDEISILESVLELRRNQQ